MQLSVKTLERLFDSLLDISKIESGVIKPCLAASPLWPLIEQVVEAERALAARNASSCARSAPPHGCRAIPRCSSGLLKNLVTNAIRYTERGRIVVGCRRAARSACAWR